MYNRRRLPGVSPSVAWTGGFKLVEREAPGIYPALRAASCAPSAHFFGREVMDADVAVWSLSADSGEQAMIVGAVERAARDRSMVVPATEWIAREAFEKSAARVCTRM